MFVEIGLEREGLVAAVAGEVLEGGVGLHVCPQVGPVSEGLAAVRAPVRLLPRVRAHVTLQEPGPAEMLAADRARVLEVVREHVHGEGRHGDVDLVAVRALLGVLAVQRAVRLLVAGQVGRCGVVLPALVARVPLPASWPAHADPAAAADHAASAAEPASAPGVRASGVAVQRVAALGSPVADEEGVVGVAHGDPVAEEVFALLLPRLVLLEFVLELLVVLLLLLKWGFGGGGLALQAGGAGLHVLPLCRVTAVVDERGGDDVMDVPCHRQSMNFSSSNNNDSGSNSKNNDDNNDDDNYEEEDTLVITIIVIMAMVMMPTTTTLIIMMMMIMI